MSAPDPTAGERRVHKPGCGIEFTWAPGDCTCPATPDADDASEEHDCDGADENPLPCWPACQTRRPADDASEPLTEAERDYLRGLVIRECRHEGRTGRDWCCAACHHLADRVGREAAAATKARADALHEAADVPTPGPAIMCANPGDRDEQWRQMLRDRADRITRGDT